MDNNHKLNYDETASWIVGNFKKLECTKFIPKDETCIMCGCGRTIDDHEEYVINQLVAKPVVWEPHVRWNVKKHTKSSPTDSFGVLEFEGTSHPTRAQYIRLSHSTKPALVVKLLTQVWQVPLPKLVLSVLGDSHDFPLNPKLKDCLSSGLLKDVHTTGGWIITNGINAGSSEHIGDAFRTQSPKVKANTVIIGIAPWGMVEGKHMLIGRNNSVAYNPLIKGNGEFYSLNNNHSYFLLVDNGTQGSFLSTYLFRRLLEHYIAKQVKAAKGSYDPTPHPIPLISLTLSGSVQIIKDVIECVTSVPPVPVVVCDGSGNASDLLAFYLKNSKKRSFECLQNHMKQIIKRTFPMCDSEAEKVIDELTFLNTCRDQIAVFEYWKSDIREMDHCILRCVLETHYNNDSDKLAMALSWNNADIARDFIFNVRRGLLEGSLDEGMTEALLTNKVEFVRLFLENGLSMQKFLTFKKLETLYTMSIGPANTLSYLLRDVQKGFRPQTDHSFTLVDIGLVVEKLMGYGFRCIYTRKTFREIHMEQKVHHDSVHDTSSRNTFAYPYNELMIWCILTKRHDLALFIWERGEQVLAKALMGMKLNRALANEAESDELESGISEEFMNYSRTFAQLSLAVVDRCFKEDVMATHKLLTCEMKNLSEWTCLFISALCNHKEFIAHPSCQMLLSDLWMGGMEERKYLTWKVIAGILCFPCIFIIDFKTETELQDMPQTEEEHLQEMYSSDSSDSDDSDSCSDDGGIPMERRTGLRRHRSRQLSAELSGAHHCSIENIVATSPKDIAINGGLFTNVNSEIIIKMKDPSHTRSEDTRSTSNICDLQSLRDGWLKKLTKDRKHRRGELKVGKKIYEFYNAPITKFFENCILYIFFVVLYTYIVLVRTPEQPSWPEVFVWMYVFSLALERIMDYLYFPIRQNARKFRTYFFNFETICETGSISMFAIAVIMRSCGDRQNARVVYATNIIYWYLRSFSFLIVEKHIGPIIHIAARNIIDLLQFVVVLLVSMMAFGANRQGLKFQNETFHWTLVKNMFLEPYFMLYGEVYAGDIDPPCTHPSDPGCQIGHWITPLTMSIYMIICNILLLSILIARLNSTFSRISSNSSQYWKFQRYHYVMKFEAKPILPAPLVIISFLLFIVKYCCRVIKDEPKPLNQGLKVYLNDKQTESLHDFEEQCVEEHFYNLAKTGKEMLETRAMKACDRVDQLSSKTDQLFHNNYAIRYNLQLLETRLQVLEQQNQQLIECSRRVSILSAEPEYIQTRRSSSIARSQPTPSAPSLFNYSAFCYEPNSVSQLASMLVPMEGLGNLSNMHVPDESQIQPIGGDHQRGRLVEKVLKRRARKRSLAGDKSMLMFDCSSSEGYRSNLGSKSSVRASSRSEQQPGAVGSVGFDAMGVQRNEVLKVSEEDEEESLEDDGAAGTDLYDPNMISEISESNG